ncbi:MAG: hypothetical protein AB7N76_31660 [Planctomycetota bacterium]
MRRALAAALALACLSGCGSLSEATVDNTQLAGEVPTGLGRYLEVRVDAPGEALQRELREAVRREFVRGGLFERVRDLEPGAARSPQVSELRVAVEARHHEQLFDLFEWTDAYVERYELTIELRDERDKQVLRGHITGLGVDAVSEPVFVDDAKREDVRLSALHDAAMKMSRALRQAANARAAKAYESLPQVELARPVGLALLGCDDDQSLRQLQSPVLLHHLRRAFPRLGKSYLLVAQTDLDAALEEPVASFLDLPAHRLQPIAARLPQASLFLVGKVEAQAGEVRCTARVLDRKGAVVVTHEASASGLGALPVLAAKLARGIAQKLQALERQGS